MVDTTPTWHPSRSAPPTLTRPTRSPKAPPCDVAPTSARRFRCGSRTTCYSNCATAPLTTTALSRSGSAAPSNESSPASTTDRKRNFGCGTGDRLPIPCRVAEHAITLDDPSDCSAAERCVTRIKSSKLAVTGGHVGGHPVTATQLGPVTSGIDAKQVRLLSIPALILTRPMPLAARPRRSGHP